MNNRQKEREYKRFIKLRNKKIMRDMYPEDYYEGCGSLLFSGILAFILLILLF